MKHKLNKKIFSVQVYLELLELLLGAWRLGDFEDIEAHGLGERSALTNGHDIADNRVTECWGAMDRHVAMPLLESVVLLNEVQVIPPDNDSAGHLHLSDHAGQDTSSDADIASEGALLVNVGALAGLTGCLEA